MHFRLVLDTEASELFSVFLSKRVFSHGKTPCRRFCEIGQIGFSELYRINVVLLQIVEIIFDIAFIVNRLFFSVSVATSFATGFAVGVATRFAVGVAARFAVGVATRFAVSVAACFAAVVRQFSRSSVIIASYQSESKHDDQTRKYQISELFHILLFLFII